MTALDRDRNENIALIRDSAAAVAPWACAVAVMIGLWGGWTVTAAPPLRVDSSRVAALLGVSPRGHALLIGAPELRPGLRDSLVAAPRALPLLQLQQEIGNRFRAFGIRRIRFNMPCRNAGLFEALNKHVGMFDVNCKRNSRLTVAKALVVTDDIAIHFRLLHRIAEVLVVVVAG